MPPPTRDRAGSDDFTLILPRIAPLSSGCQLPELERLASFAVDGVVPSPLHPSFEFWQGEVLDALGIGSERPVAVGATTWLGETGERPGAWCAMAQPVTLSMSASGLSLQVASWDEAQCAAAATALRSHLKEYRMELRAVGARAFLHGESLLDVQTAAPGHVGDHSLRDHLPTGPDSVLLRRLMTEVQMILHEKMPEAGFNSLWFWGTGAATAPVLAETLPSMVTNEAFVRGLYLSSGAQDKVRDAIAPAIAPGAMAVIRTDQGDVAGQWLTAVLNALKDCTIAAARIHLDGSGFLAKYSLWRRWFGSRRRSNAM